MSWVRFEDDVTENPKVIAVGPLAWALDVAGIAYCGRNLTDGFVPAGKVPGLLNFTGITERGKRVDADKLAARLVTERRWIQAPGGFMIHDYLKYNPSRAQVLAERERSRLRRLEVRPGDDPPEIQGELGVRPPVDRRSILGPVPVPVPEPAKKKEEEREAREKLRAERRAARGCSLPPDFTLTEKRKTFAVAGGIHDAEFVFGHFKDHHKARGTIFKDWDAAWQTWCRREVQIRESRQHRMAR